MKRLQDPNPVFELTRFLSLPSVNIASEARPASALRFTSLEVDERFIPGQAMYPLEK